MVAALPEDFRTVFVLRAVEGMSGAEVAECLGIAEETVKTRLFRARRRLQEMLVQSIEPSLPSIYEFHLSRCDRVVAAVLCQPVGHRPENPDVMYKSGKDNWAPALLSHRPDLNMAQVDMYLHNLYRVQPDFVYSVSRDFARSC